MTSCLEIHPIGGRRFFGVCVQYVASYCRFVVSSMARIGCIVSRVKLTYIKLNTSTPCPPRGARSCSGRSGIVRRWAEDGRISSVNFRSRRDRETPNNRRHFRFDEEVSFSHWPLTGFFRRRVKLARANNLQTFRSSRTCFVVIRFPSESKHTSISK